MRKLVVLLVVVIMAVGIMPVMAQDTTGTIADVVVASTQGDAPEFTVLLAAVSAADPAFLEALSNPEGVYTVFAPTDAAFTQLLTDLGTTAEELLANTDLLNTVLAYHVVPGAFSAATVAGLDGAYLGTILPGEALLISVDGDAVKVNDSTVVAADVAASNGVIHVIDTVLVPAMDDMGGEAMMATEEAMDATEEPMMEEMGTIADIVVASTKADAPEFTTLLAAVSAADPVVLSLLSGTSGPFTVFAPTDAAFGQLLTDLNTTPEDLLANTDLVNTVLGYHVVPGEFTAADFVSYLGDDESVSFATLQGTAITFNGAMINASNLVATDIYASNGVVHVIDAVLVPAAE